MFKRFIATIGIIMLLTSSGWSEGFSIVGTGDGVNILDAITKAFTSKYPDITIDIPESIGSSGGIKAVAMDKAIIARVAREIEEKEKSFGLTYIPFAKVATVFFVNKTVDVTNLSEEQICGIYSGMITNWKDVGGKDAKIRVIRREDGDSSLKVLQSQFPGFKDITITTLSKTAFSTPEIFSDVESIPDSIGFGPYDVAKKANVTILKIKGISPDSLEYPYTTTLGLVFKEANKTGMIQKFIEFVTSPAIHEVIKKSGGFPFN